MRKAAIHSQPCCTHTHIFVYVCKAAGNMGHLWSLCTCHQVYCASAHICQPYCVREVCHTQAQFTRTHTGHRPWPLRGHHAWPQYDCLKSTIKFLLLNICFRSLFCLHLLSPFPSLFTFRTHYRLPFSLTTEFGFLVISSYEIDILILML